jgi:hypothetical protein
LVTLLRDLLHRRIHFQASVKRLLLIIAVLVAVGAAWALVRRKIPSSVDYRGQQIKLTKYYFDYDDYKNDPDNIDPSETARVQRMVSEAPIAHSFASRKDAASAVFEIRFPGFGAGGFGPIQKGEGDLNGFSIEIPRADKNRYFIFRNVHGSYLFVDDFQSDTGIQTVREERGKLVYYTPSGQANLTRPIMTAR